MPKRLTGILGAPRPAAAPGADHDQLSESSVTFKAECTWIDGTEPTACLRSKTKMMADGKDLPIWGFDGSSTNQAPGKNSDCVLQPAFACASA